MIVTCPECSVRFLLASNVLGEEGHNVRCSSCGHIWHQMPEDEFAEEEELKQEEPKGEEAKVDAPEEESLHEESLDKDDFGAVLDALEKSDSRNDENQEEGENEGSVYPDVPQSLRMHRAPPPGVKKKSGHAATFMAPPAMAGYGAALLVFLLIFGVLYIAKDSAFRAYPASAAFYSLLGVDFTVPGEGLVFDSVQVTHARQNGKISIEGTVINLSPEKQDVPLIEAALVDDKQRVIERWYIQTPFEIITGEGAEFFNVHYAPSTKLDIESLSLSLRFVLKGRDDASVKSASAGGGNNPVPHAGG